MFAVRRAITRSLCSVSLRNAAPQITRARVTPLSAIPSRCFSQIRPRFAEEPVQEEPSAAELEEVKEKSILEPEAAQSHQEAASTSSQAHAATSESTDEVSEQPAAPAPTSTASEEQQIAATSESTHRAPKKEGCSIFVANLLFEVQPAQLKEFFSKVGTVIDAKVAMDDRGLSKGFGFVQFENPEEAQRAIAELDESSLQGRTLIIRPANDRPNRERRSGGGRQRNAPSKTVFIGNMSYQMSDLDLTDLFSGIKNVLDVRVAVDRRSGQPRGFAHADFKDIESAEEAVKLLQGRVIYGRALKVDYTPDNKMTPAGQ